MVFVSGLDREPGSVKFDSLGRIVERHEEPVPGLDLLFMLYAVEWIAGIIPEDLVAIQFDSSICQRGIQKIRVLAGRHIGHHDLVGIRALNIFVLSKSEFAGRDGSPRRSDRYRCRKPASVH